mmetsp:Transcript_48290/g.134850  ORF Transcript_48290/g.134850 Transcript_48290/m.134850 type:complete len:347 (+) Transcript_48290:79-1119(+)
MSPGWFEWLFEADGKASAGSDLGEVEAAEQVSGDELRQIVNGSLPVSHCKDRKGQRPAPKRRPSPQVSQDVGGSVGSNHEADEKESDPSTLHAEDRLLPIRVRVPARRYGPRVFIRVYDLGRAALLRPHNIITRNYGAFHTGVEVYGREWSFGMTLDDYQSGILWNMPGRNMDHSFRETLAMGATQLSPVEVMQLIAEMSQEWKGGTYNLLTRNCHNFSDELCRRLGVGGLPSWLNDLAEAGAATADFMDSAYSGATYGAAAAIKGATGLVSGLNCFDSAQGRKIQADGEIEPESDDDTFAAIFEDQRIGADRKEELPSMRFSTRVSSQSNLTASTPGVSTAACEV